MRGQEKVYQLPIPEEDKMGEKDDELKLASHDFITTSKKVNTKPHLDQSFSAAAFLDTFLTPARSHSPSDSSSSLTPPLGLGATSDLRLVGDSLLTPATSPDEESLEPWIQTV
jgi:hypothetical protein